MFTDRMKWIVGEAVMLGLTLVVLYATITATPIQ